MIQSRLTAFSIDVWLVVVRCLAVIVGVIAYLAIPFDWIGAAFRAPQAMLTRHIQEMHRHLVDE